MTAIRKWPFSLAALSGLLLIASEPPVSLFFLAYIAFVPLFLDLDPSTPRHNFVTGFVSGTVAYTGLLYWVVVAMNTYGGIGIPFAVLALVLLAAYLGLYTGLFTWSLMAMEKRSRLPACLTGPLVWILLEYLRGILLTGFPWSLLAHSQYNFLPLVQVVSLTGTYFLSFLIMAVNLFLVRIVQEKRFPIAHGITLGVVFALCLAYGTVRLADRDRGRLQATIVQGNIRQDVKWGDAFKVGTLRTYTQMTADSGGDASIVIWPETALAFVFDNDPLRTFIPAISSALSTSLLFGTISRDDADRYYNSAYLFGQKGERVGVYRKVHLVPFGEYTPLRSYLPFLERFSVNAGDFFSGPGHDPLPADLGKVGILVCFEGVFPSITNETVRKGAEVLVNLTNDAWFGRTSAPYQHLAFYVFRAVESDRFVLRAANTGISAIIDPRGRIEARTGLFEKTALKGGFTPRNGLTFYVRHGDYIVFLAFVALLCLVTRNSIVASRRKRMSRTRV